MTLEGTVPTDIEVCTDCILLIANGETTDGDGIAADKHAKRMEAVWGIPVDITLGGRDDIEDDDPHFSWKPCEGCGSPLGGDRYAATAWTEA
jgi:hypothetical protein